MDEECKNFASVNDQYNNDHNLKQEDVFTLQQWMAKKSHLPTISELKIILFLHSNQYKIEVTKQCIEHYYTIKANCDEIFGHFDIHSKAMKNTTKMMLINTVASKPEYKVIIGRVQDPDPDLMQLGPVFGLCDIMTHLSYALNRISDGHVVILDGSTVRFSHVFKFSPMITKIFIFFVQSALPIRLKKIHVVNVSSAVEKLYAFIKPFVNAELLSMLHLHSSLEDFHKHLPMDCIPKDLGGIAASFDELYDNQMKILEVNADYIKAFVMEKADETRRQEKIDFGDMFGYEGTFKKLQID